MESRLEQERNTRIANIKNLLKELGNGLKEYENEENLDWGHIGDLGRIEGSLQDLADNELSQQEDTNL